MDMEQLIGQQLCNARDDSAPIVVKGGQIECNFFTNFFVALQLAEE